MDASRHTLRERARARGLSLLECEPWATVADRASLLLLDPPNVEWAIETEPATLWLIVERELVRHLPNGSRDALHRERVLIEEHRGPAEVAVDLVVFTVEGVTDLIEGISRRSLEARWGVRHAEPLRDKMRRQEQLASAAENLPDGALERIIRPLYLQSVAATAALGAVAPGDAASLLAAAGEAAGSLARLACVIEAGSHPPPRHLLLAARETALGRRLVTWLDDLAPLLGGDGAAGRRIAGSRDQVIEETTRLLGPQFRDRPWLKDPASYALRSSR